MNFVTYTLAFWKVGVVEEDLLYDIKKRNYQRLMKRLDKLV